MSLHKSEDDRIDQQFGRFLPYLMSFCVPLTYTFLTDGVNANHHAEDYRLTIKSHHAGEQLTIKMASGGGFVLKITPW